MTSTIYANTGKTPITDKGDTKLIAKVNGVELYYEKQGSGRPLLMIHGNGEDHTIFREAVAVLKNHFTVYTPDSRDHGRSSRVKELHYEDMAEDLLQFMEALDLRDTVFYGFSDGGILGLLAAQKTDRITHLITSGANLTPDAVSLLFKLLIRGMYLVKREQKIYMMLTEPNIQTEDLKNIKVPTLVIAGEKDLILRKETERIASAIPDSRLLILPGEDHGSYIIHQTKIADLILKEVRRQTGS